MTITGTLVISNGRTYVTKDGQSYALAFKYLATAQDIQGWINQRAVVTVTGQFFSLTTESGNEVTDILVDSVDLVRAE